MLLKARRLLFLLFCRPSSTAVARRTLPVTRRRRRRIHQPPAFAGAALLLERADVSRLRVDDLADVLVIGDVSSRFV